MSKLKKNWKFYIHVLLASSARFDDDFYISQVYTKKIKVLWQKGKSLLKLQLLQQSVDEIKFFFSRLTFVIHDLKISSVFRF